MVVVVASYLGMVASGRTKGGGCYIQGDWRRVRHSRMFLIVHL